MTAARAPATPLIVHDPFFSVWSAADALTDNWPTHWTGRPIEMAGHARIDGKVWRFMGGNTRMTADLPAMEQVARHIGPTTTTYDFEAAGVELSLSFTTPALPDAPHLMARPATYITCAITSGDGAPHEVEIYLDLPATITTDNTEAAVIWGRHQHGDTSSVWCGSLAQPVLGRTGDECLTDWGYLHLSPQQDIAVSTAIGDARSMRLEFARVGKLPNVDGFAEGGGRPLPFPASGGEARHGNRPPVLGLAVSKSFGTVTKGRWSVVVAYDHVQQIEYMNRRLPPLWRRQDATAIAMIHRAWAEKNEVEGRCRAFDEELTADMHSAAGPHFARLGTLAFRQCLGGHALVADRNGDLLHFSKENSSNGCMGTVDLVYPGSPFFLLFNPDLLMAQMRPVLDYAASSAWTFPFAPHDLGRYPIANGQVYGGGETGEENQMPFEECGNMLILAAALSRVKADPELFRAYWPTLAKWAGYLVDQGFDPDEQLCTDDFDGHMAHNANLSAKGIVALGAAAQLAQALGVDGDAYRKAAEKGAQQWLGSEQDGPHYRMCFDRPESWSQKYNLIWDRFLQLGLFKQDVLEVEMAKYRQEMRAFGVPLHSIASHTKLDWLVWTACLTGRHEDRELMLERISSWLDSAPVREPLSDWYDADTGAPAKGHGFRGRPVVGGVFLPMMLDRALLDKWSNRS